MANSTGALQNQSYECGARTRALRVLRVHSAHTPSSPPSGGTNSMILFTVAAVQSTCGSRGSPHAVSMKGRQRRHRGPTCQSGPPGRLGEGCMRHARTMARIYGTGTRRSPRECEATAAIPR